MVLTWNRLKSIAKPEFIGRSIVALGFVLRLRQYLANRSLWGDEASLAVNIVSRSFIGLTEPLGFHQAAPVGFLIIEKFFIVLFGNNDFILRLFPLLSGILAIYLIHRIASDYFGVFGLFAVLMFALNSWLIFFSSELKQYGNDVTVALLLVYLSIRCLKENPRVWDFLWLAIAGVVTIWISHVAVFILAGIGLALVLEKFGQKKYVPFAWLPGLGMAWLISFGADYFFALQYTAADKYFRSYWLKSFLPLPPWDNVPWLGSVYNKFLLIALNGTNAGLAYLLPALAIIGCFSLFIRRRNVALIVTLPFIMTLIASAWQKYPLTYRFMLFLIPLTFLLLAEGIAWIYMFLAKQQKWIAFIVCIVPVSIMLLFSTQKAITDFKSPPTISEIKPVMKYVEENIQARDIIYLYYGSVPAFIYYAPFYNLDSENIVAGVYRQNEEKALAHFFEDVQGLKGNNRVWFIISEIAYCGGCKGDSSQFFTSYLDENGMMADRFLAANSAAYLYDLNP